MHARAPEFNATAGHRHGRRRAVLSSAHKGNAVYCHWPIALQVLERWRPRSGPAGSRSWRVRLTFCEDCWRWSHDRRAPAPAEAEPVLARLDLEATPRPLIGVTLAPTRQHAVLGRRWPLLPRARSVPFRGRAAVNASCAAAA